MQILNVVTCVGQAVSQPASIVFISTANVIVHNRLHAHRSFVNTMSCRALYLQVPLTSIMFLFVSDSCGSLYSVYLSSTLSMSVLAYWYNLLLLEKMISAISQSHSTDSSYAFFITPNFRLLKVTCFGVKENAH